MTPATSVRDARHILDADIDALLPEDQAKIRASLRRMIDFYASTSGVVLPSDSAPPPLNVIRFPIRD